MPIVITARTLFSRKVRYHILDHNPEEHSTDGKPTRATSLCGIRKYGWDDIGATSTPEKDGDLCGRCKASMDATLRHSSYQINNK